MSSCATSNLVASSGQSAIGFAGPYIEGYDAFNDGIPFCDASSDAWQRGWINASEDKAAIDRWLVRSYDEESLELPAMRRPLSLAVGC